MKQIKDLMSLEGKRVLITGAMGGIGKKIAESVAELGGNIVLVDRPGSYYLPLIEEVIRLWDVEIDCYDCDLECENDRLQLINSILDDGKGLDVLVNNAGFVGTSGLTGWVTKFENQSVETWRRALEVNLTSVFDLCKGLSPLLKSNNNGVIINIASIYATSAPDYSLYEGTEMGNPAAYNASKGGEIQLTRWLSTALAPSVRVNAISPGGVFRKQPDIFVERYESRTPLGRMATEDDFKGAITYLATELSSYVTGQNIMVDGGWSVW